MRINSHNEWDNLREVIVGRGGKRACLEWPRANLPDPALVEKAHEIAREAYPNWLVEEIEEDHEGLYRVLREFGAKVLRPANDDTDRFFTTGMWGAAGDNVCNARDLHLVVGNTLIESPSQERHRFLEATSYYPIWYEYFRNGGFRWVTAPKPRLMDGYLMHYTDPAIPESETRPDGGRLIKLTEDEILFEAANTVRMGRDLLYLVSRSGNRLGAQWLQSVLGDDYRVHTTSEIYRSSHIDSTVLCLRPGLVLLNAFRVNEQNCPEVLKKWERIYFTDVVPTPEEEVDFHRKVRKKVYAKLADLGFQSNLDSLSSDWIGMNFLSLDPRTIVIDERQVPLIRLLEKHGFDCIPISFRHSYITGGIHCNTLDTVRDSRLESYCDSKQTPTV